MDLNPLFNTNILRFYITVTSQKRLNIKHIGLTYRGKLGYFIKQISCLYDQFQKTDCADCTMHENCHYLELFSPISNPQILNDGTVKILPSPVRPFVFSFITEKMNATICTKETFKIIFSVFGPAIEKIAIFSAAAVQASEAMGMSFKSLDILYPEKANILDDNQTHIIYDWLNVEDVDIRQIKLLCHTPLSLKKNNQIIDKGLSLVEIVKAIIRRLRDLKRHYGNDKNMGQIEKQFYSHAKLIDSSINLKYQKIARYSHSQDKAIALSGFVGEIILSGNIFKFIPLFKAAEIIHIGRGTSSGNGLMFKR